MHIKHFLHSFDPLLQILSLFVLKFPNMLCSLARVNVCKLIFA